MSQNFVTSRHLREYPDTHITFRARTNFDTKDLVLDSIRKESEINNLRKTLKITPIEKKITVTKYIPISICISTLLFFFDRRYFSIGDDSIANPKITPINNADFQHLNWALPYVWTASQ